MRYEDPYGREALVEKVEDLYYRFRINKQSKELKQRIKELAREMDFECTTDDFSVNSPYCKSDQQSSCKSMLVGSVVVTGDGYVSLLMYRCLYR